MEPALPKNILDWNDSDLSTLVDTVADDQIEDIPLHQRYEDLDHYTLEVIAKNLTDGIENRTFSLSLAENIDSKDKKHILTQKLEKSIDRTKAELSMVQQELNGRPEISRSLRDSFPLPRTVSEFVKDINLSLLSQILSGSFGSNRSEFHQRYLTFIEYCRSYDLTWGQLEQIFRMFLRDDMLTYWMDIENDTPTIEKLKGLLTIFFKGPSISDRLRQIKEFERSQAESLESAILRLGLLLDKTETLFPRQHRESRREIFISNAISRLSHPMVRSKIERFKKEVFMSRRFISSEQLLRKCSEIEMLNGCLDNEAIRLNYDDPFLSNEAKNSLLEKEKKPRTDKLVRFPENIQNDRSSDHSIRTELDEVKKLLHSINSRRPETMTGNEYSRYNRQHVSNKNDFYGRNRPQYSGSQSRPQQTHNRGYNIHPQNYRPNDWSNTPRPDAQYQPAYHAQKEYMGQPQPHLQSPNPHLRSRNLNSDEVNKPSSGYNSTNPFKRNQSEKGNITAEGLSELTKVAPN